MALPKKEASGVTMENSIIFLPTLQNGVIGLGDLWDCRQSAATGNLFETSFVKEDIVAYPIKNLEYELKRVKNLEDALNEMHVSASLSIEALGGGLKVAGKASFGREARKKFHEEMIVCNYDLTTYAVRLNRTDNVSQLVKNKIVNDRSKSILIILTMAQGSISATHYVDTVFIGGQAQASIKYAENADKSNFHITGQLAGELTLGPISASAKLSMEMFDEKYSEQISTFIDIQAQPSLTNPPTNCSEMFTAIESIDANIQKERHFQVAEVYPNQITGVPLRFRLLPLSQIMNLGQDETFKMLKEEVLESYRKMLTTLEAYSDPDGDHIKSLLLQGLPTILPILFDASHPITKEIGSWAKGLSTKAIGLKQSALKLFGDYKYGLKTEIELAQFVSEYDETFPLSEILAKIQKFEDRARHELGMLRLQDSIDSRAQFFSNEQALKDWMAVDRTTKLLLQTKSNKFEDIFFSRNGIFAAFYELSPFLVAVGVEVGTAFPSASTDFSLTLKTSNGNQKIFKRNEIFKALHLLSTLLDPTKGSHATTLFHKINAELAGIKLFSSSAIIQEFPTLYSLMEGYTKDGLTFTESYVELLAKLGSTPKTIKYSFVFPVDGLTSAIYQVQAYKKFHQLFSSIPRSKVNWIFSKVAVAIRGEDQCSAPLLLVFKQDVLHFVCLDMNDVSILYHQMSQGKEDSTLGIDTFGKCCFQIPRANFTIQLLPNVILSHSKKYELPLEQPPSFPSSPAIPELLQAIQVGRAVAFRMDKELFCLLVKFAIADNVHLEMMLQQFGFLNGEISQAFWAELDWASFGGELSKFLRSQTITAGKILAVQEDLHNLKGDEEEGDEAFHQLIDQRIQFILESSEPELQPLKVEIEKYSADLYNPYERKERLDDAFNVFITKIAEAKENFQIHQLLFLSSEMGSRGKLSHVYIQVLSLYVNKITTLDDRGPLQKALQDGEIFNLLGVLDSYRAHPLLLELNGFLDLIGFSNFPCPQHVKSLIENLIKLDEEQLEFIWSSPKFIYMIKVHLNQGAVVNALVELIGYLLENSITKTIPFYIPPEVVEAVKPKLSKDKITEDFAWNMKWNDLSVFLEQLEIFFARKEIPEGFNTAFLTNIDNNHNLKEQMKENQVLFHYEEEENIFSQPWSMLTVSKAIERLSMEPGSKALLKISSLKIMVKPKTPISQHSIEVDDAWHEFLKDGLLPLQNFVDFSRLPSPSELKPFSIEYNHRDQSLVQMMTKMVPHIKMSNVNPKLNHSSVFQMVNYYDGKARISRSDLLTALFNAFKEDPLAIHFLLRQIFASNAPLPLNVQNMEKDKVGQHVSLLREIRAVRILTPSCKFVLTLRAGNTFPEIGRSSLLNKYLMRDPNAFGSKAEDGGEFGVPISKNGFLEFIPISEKTINPLFWDHLNQQFNNSDEHGHLGCLHGNIFKIPFNQNYFQNLQISTIVIFWKAKDWKHLQGMRNELRQIMDLSQFKVLDIVLYPDESIVKHVDEGNLIRKDLGINVEEGNGPKLFKLFTFALQHPPIDGINVDAEDPKNELITFIKGHGILKIKMGLTNLDSEITKSVVEKFTCLLDRLDLAEMNLVKEELEMLSKNETRECAAKISKIRHQIKDSYAHSQPQDADILELQNELKMELKKFSSNALSTHDLFRITFQSTSEENMAHFTNMLASFISFGLPVEIVPSLGNVLKALPALEALSILDPTTRIFVISVVGLQESGKSTLLNRLFGNCPGFVEGMPTIGSQIKLHWVSERMKQELKCDAVLLLDSQGVGCQENKMDDISDSLERSFVAWLLTVADTTLLTILGSELGEMLEILEMALLLIAGKSDPRICLIQQQIEGQNEEQVEMQLNALKEMVKAVASYAGHNTGSTLSNIYRDILLSKINHIINQFKNEDLYYDDICSLYEKLFNDISNSKTRRKLLGDWVKECKAQWENLAHAVPKNILNQNINTTKINQGRDKMLAEVKNSISSAIFSHVDAITLIFVNELKDLFEEEFHPGFQIRLQLLLKQVVNQLSQLIDNCHGDGNNTKLKKSQSRFSQNPGNKGLKVKVESNSCNPCREAFILRESYFTEIRELKRAFLLKEEVTFHTNQVKLLIYNRLSQIALAAQISEKRSEELKTFMDRLIAKYGNEAAPARFLSFLSTLQTVSPSASFLHQELLTEWGDEVNQMFPKEGELLCPMIDLQKIAAFQGCHPSASKLKSEEFSWILLKLNQIVAEVLTDFETQLDSHYFSIYQFGMYRKLNKLVKAKLALFKAYCNRGKMTEFRKEFIFKTHMLATQLFVIGMATEDEKWNEFYNPVTALRRNWEEFAAQPDNYFIDFSKNLKT